MRVAGEHAAERRRKDAASTCPEKSSGLEVSDRIVLTWSAQGETAEAFTSHRDLIAAEVLATTTTPAVDADSLDGVLEDLGFAFSVAKA